MAPIILKVKGNNQSSPFGNLDSTEDLSKTWRVCTKVKDSLENGSRLENLSWRLWYSHNNQKKKTAPPSFKIPDNFDFNKKKTVQEKEIEYKRKLKLQQQKQAQQIIQEQQLKLEKLASDQAQSQVIDLNPTFKNYIYPTNETDMTQQAIHTDPSFVNQNWPIEDYSLACNPQEFYNEGSALYVSAESMPPIPIGTLHNRILATLPKETLESAERFILSSAENEIFLQQPFVQSTPTSPFFSFPLVQQPIQQSMIQPPAYHPYTPPMSSILNDTNEKALCQSKSLPASRASSPVFHPPSPLSPNKKNTPVKRSPISTSPADGKAPICSNCNTTTTPLWRRSGDDELLCNACGLYLKLHNTPRPKHFKPQSLRKDSKDEENLIQPVCSNCSTSTTPLWRRDVDGLPLCNACGLYLKLHHEKRPLSMKTDNIKKRQRTENVSNDKLKKMKAKSLEENEGNYQFMEDIVHTNNSSSSFSPLGQFNCTA